MAAVKVFVEGDVDFQTGEKIFDVLENRRGQLYPQLTRDIQRAIGLNAHPSYANSLAKDMAIESASQWQHFPNIHTLEIISDLFANYRQYGCGGLEIATLVDLTESDIDLMVDHIVEEAALGIES